jgi:asparagine synthase (glutamine-hydrolysing)
MCGISGIVGNVDSGSYKIKLMIKALRHRGPDNQDYYEDKGRGVYLGHNRLSIIDLSDKASQPMFDASGDYIIVFNGEIYNHEEIRKSLQDYPFKSRSDTEVILAAYIKWGKYVLDHLVGMFSFAIWNINTKTLFCARDRFGEKPFYWVFSSKTFYFASEIKALKAAGIKLEINSETMALYLSRGLFESGENTFFTNIMSLPPGHFIIYKQGEVPKLEKYWDLENYKVSKQKDTEYYEGIIENSLTQSLKLQIHADVPVGLNLSSGLDSQVLLGLIKKHSLCETLNTFTFGFDSYKNSDASLVSQSYQEKNILKHIFLFTPNEMLDELSKIYFYQEGPIGGLSTLGYSRLHKKINEFGFKVVLEGQGADEIFAGYSYYQQPFSLNNVYQDGSPYLRSECITDDVHKIASNILSKERAGLNSLSLVDRQINDIKLNKLPRVLRMNDRLSMASGVELREPFLDHRISEKFISAPENLKIANGSGKLLLRNFSKKLKINSRNQAKLGNTTPQLLWMKTHFKDYISDLIDSNIFKTSGYFDSIAVKNIFKELTNRKNNNENTFYIWQWISYVELIKQVVDSGAD